MKKSLVAILIFALGSFAGSARAEEAKDLAKTYPMVSVPYSVPDNDDRNFSDVDFRFAWTSKKPFVVALQFTNRSYYTRKIRFAILDAKTKKTVVLDAVHHSRSGSATMEPNSVSGIWSGPVAGPDRSFILRVWTEKGDMFEKEPIAFSDQQ